MDWPSFVLPCPIALFDVNAEGVPAKKVGFFARNGHKRQSFIAKMEFIDLVVQN
jgi:hypothetical protein